MDSPLLPPNTLLRRETKFKPRMSLYRKVLHTPPTLDLMSGSRVAATFGSLDGVGGLRIPGGPFHLALDLLRGCGMMQQSEEGFVAGLEARDLRNSRAASLVAHSAKNTRYVLPGLASKPSSRW
jgi:hypothetical protein